MARPQDYGLPKKFREWRRGQEQAVRILLYGRDRFNLLNIPVGGGKTATYMSYVLANPDERHLILTHSHALLDQLFAEFRKKGLEDVRGRGKYVCLIEPTKMADDGKCTAGMFCEYMRGDNLCEYYDRRRIASESNVVGSTYAFWLHNEESDAIGSFDTVICDEAHIAPDEISNFAKVRITRRELDRFGIMPPGSYGRRVSVRIKEWGPRALDVLNEAEDEAKTRGFRSFADRKMAKDLGRKLQRLCRLGEEDWIFSADGREAWRWDLVDPGALAEDLLFRGAKKVVLSSSTVRRKTLQLLGVDDKVKVVEQASTFPVANRPIYYWPQAKVGRGMTGHERGYLFEAMRHICDTRDDRSGLIHCVSYEFGKEIDDYLRLHGVRTFLHVSPRRGGPSVAEFVEMFKSKKRGTVAISPSMDTGVDLPYSLCEFAIIPKMPFPGMADPLIKARQKRDRTYTAYLTLQRLQQSVGRHVRFDDDKGETFILDAHYGWMRNAYWEFISKWFTNAIRTVASRDLPPTPPARLAS
jgi:Rad3-related DNA helicase